MRRFQIALKLTYFNLGSPPFVEGYPPDMGDATQTNDRGTWNDWPLWVGILGVVLFLFAVNGGTPLGVLSGLVLAVFGLLTWLARRGTFSPRRD